MSRQMLSASLGSLRSLYRSAFSSASGMLSLEMGFNLYIRSLFDEGVMSNQ